jgi:hypothetical protein
MNIVDTLTQRIQKSEPVVFAKFGDGEYFCAIFNENERIHGDHNCDNDNYTYKKKQGLIDSFKYLVEHIENCYIGKWHFTEEQLQFWKSVSPDPNLVRSTKEQNDFWGSLVSNPNNIKWAQYNTLIIDENDLHTDEFQKKVQLYRAIKESKLKKIVVCNELLIKTQRLLNADHMVIVSMNNWFDTQLENVIQQIKDLIGTDEKFILTTSAGMGAKVLIGELCKTHPMGIYLDIGSALDLLCTKKDSRGFRQNPGYHYDRFYKEFSDLLPEDWNDEKYNPIYEQAQYKLGLHLR